MEETGKSQCCGVPLTHRRHRGTVRRPKVCVSGTSLKFRRRVHVPDPTPGTTDHGYGVRRSSLALQSSSRPFSTPPPAQGLVYPRRMGVRHFRGSSRRGGPDPDPGRPRSPLVRKGSLGRRECHTRRGWGGRKIPGMGLTRCTSRGSGVSVLLVGRMPLISLLRLRSALSLPRRYPCPSLSPPRRDPCPALSPPRRHPCPTLSPPRRYAVQLDQVTGVGSKVLRFQDPGRHPGREESRTSPWKRSQHIIPGLDCTPTHGTDPVVSSPCPSGVP